MPQITDIRPQKRKPLFNIFIEGKYAFSLPADILLKFNLKIGQDLSKKEIKKLIRENEFLNVFNQVLKFLSFRSRSEKEVKDWFKEKRIGEETTKIVLQKLKDLGYLNNEAFLKWWLDQRATFRPMGKFRITRELRQKGIPDFLISSLKFSPSEELLLAKKAVEKKMKIWKNLPPEKFYQKISTFLAYRGFSWEAIKETIDEIRKKE